MDCPLCLTCGTEFASCARPPERCPICSDERQYVGWAGQQWTTHARLGRSHTLSLRQDDGLLGIGMTPAFAIPQRALLLPTASGNLLWECVSLVTDEAVAALQARGGVDRIVISHPHFYSAMARWSAALGDVPILLHAADRAWVQRPSPQLQFWEGETLALGEDVTLLRLGGHFPGSTGLHWRRGPRGHGVLFPGDAMQVALDRRHVAFMYSYPNHIPMRSSDIETMRERVAGLDYEDVYGFAWGRNILGGARACVERSFARHLHAVRH